MSGQLTRKLGLKHLVPHHNKTCFDLSQTIFSDFLIVAHYITSIISLFPPPFAIMTDRSKSPEADRKYRGNREGVTCFKGHIGMQGYYGSMVDV